jgi:serine/threonine-protein phosphatase PPG1
MLIKGQPVSERQLRQVCKQFSEILVEERNVLHLQSPINVVGDVHGQFYDVLRIFELGK